MQKKISWKHVASFFVAGRTFYCASEKVFANHLLADHTHDDGEPRKPEVKPPFPL
jgi:hypothetical protein